MRRNGCWSARRTSECRATFPSRAGFLPPDFPRCRDGVEPCQDALLTRSRLRRDFPRRQPFPGRRLNSRSDQSPGLIAITRSDSARLHPPETPVVTAGSNTAPWQGSTPSLKKPKSEPKPNQEPPRQQHALVPKTHDFKQVAKGRASTDRAIQNQPVFRNRARPVPAIIQISRSCPALPGIHHNDQIRVCDGRRRVLPGQRHCRGLPRGNS
jgi:hypothetical protein